MLIIIDGYNFIFTVPELERHVKVNNIEPKVMYKEIVGVLNKDKKIKSDEPEAKRNGPSETDAKYWKDVFKSLPDKEKKPCVEKTDMPMVEKKKKETSHTGDEPGYKYQGTPSDETQYWIRIFTGEKKNEHQD